MTAALVIQLAPPETAASASVARGMAVLQPWATTQALALAALEEHPSFQPLQTAAQWRINQAQSIGWKLSSAPQSPAEKDEWWAQRLAQRNKQIRELATPFSNAQQAQTWVSALWRRNGYTETNIFRDQRAAVVLRALQIAGKLPLEQPVDLHYDALALWALHKLKAYRFYTSIEITRYLQSLGLSIQKDSVSRALKGLAKRGEIEPGGRIHHEPLYREKTKDHFDDSNPIEWQNVPADRLPDEPRFQHYSWAQSGILRMGQFIFGSASCGTFGSLRLKRTVRDLLAAYECLIALSTLNQPSELWEIQRLYDHVQTVSPFEALETVHHLRKGLEWLELMGFPIRQRRRYEKGQAVEHWQVNGLARRHFACLDVFGWIQTRRREWKTLYQQPEDRPWSVIPDDLPARVARRIRLLLLVFRIPTTAKDVPWRALTRLAKGDVRFLDLAIEEWSHRLGVEPARLRWGVSRFKAKLIIISLLPRVSIGVRIRLLRQLAGMTVDSLASATGISKGALESWEANKRVPRDLESIRALSAVLDVEGHWFIAPTSSRRIREAL